MIRAIAASSLLLALFAAPLHAQRAEEDPRSLDEVVDDMLGAARAAPAQLLTHTAGVSPQEAVPGRGGANDPGAAARGLTRYDPFRIISDDSGRPYLWLGNRALAREDPE